MKIIFSNLVIPTSGAAVVAALDGRKLTKSARELNEKTGGGINRAIKASRFKGKKGQSLTVLAPQGTRLERILIIGLGKPKEIDARALQDVGGTVYAALARSGSTTASMLVERIDGCNLSGAEMAAQVGFGTRLRSYQFNKYRTKEKSKDKPTLRGINLLCNRAGLARKQFAVLDKIANGVFLTRDVISEPPNILYPETLAKRARELIKHGVRVEVLGATQMKRLGMGALLGVGQGSVRESKLVVMQWNGAPRKGKMRAEPPIAFVGKGVTFDTGGISLKPSAGMEEMKYDMGGSGVVIGLMKTLAGRKARVNAVGVVGLVENMPGGNAQRPGDIVTSMSGQTIEVLNTDAEGRLVLADALHYTYDRFNPKFMVNLATLTGAIIIALGNEYAGLFSNNDRLAQRIAKVGEVIGEKVWRLPLGATYDKMLKSDAADMKNISGGRGAGSITAAQFLQRFVGKTPWAHLDIAGVTWAQKDSAIAPKGATGFGVRLLNGLVAEHYEAK